MEDTLKTILNFRDDMTITKHPPNMNRPSKKALTKFSLKSYWTLPKKSMFIRKKKHGFRFILKKYQQLQ
jgi:hypothetical protein